MIQRRTLGMAAGGAVLAVSAIALAAYAAPSLSAPGKLSGAKVDNFMLVDQTGLGHELYYHGDQPAIVIVTAALGDPASERAIAATEAVARAYKDKKIEFFILNSSRNDSRDEIAAAAAKVGLPVLHDELQLVGRALGVSQTAEAFVITPGDWRIAYHGPIDESFAARKTAGASLVQALDAVLAGRSPQATDIKVKGAPIAFPDRARAAEFTKISYSKDVAPILEAKCVTCHVKGGMAPFAMDSYQTVKGFAPMIREALRTKRMPPFHADPHYGRWENDMRLTNEEILKVVNWVEAGAPRGSGADPLTDNTAPASEWPLGEPDMIVEIPAYDVPASGVVDYQDWSIPTKLTEGKWLKATSWKPGVRETVHHVLAGWMPQVRDDGRGFSWTTSLGGYGPGGEDNLTPDSTGIYIPAGGSFTFQMHYTPIGRKVTDATKVGLYFYDKEPEYILRQVAVTDFSLELPPGEARHKERAYLEFPHDAILYGTQPHAHYRGYASKLTIRYPDGTEKILLNQPRYDFAWQREYIFEGGLEVPAGSKLIADYVFDNSAANKYNPDPKMKVTFGEQTHEEMLFTFVRFRWKGETSSNRLDQHQRDLQAGALVGALDDNIDGKLQLAEFRNSPQFAPFRQFFGVADKNKDGGIDKAEMAEAQKLMQSMRPGRGGGSGAPAAPADSGTEAMMSRGG